MKIINDFNQRSDEWFAYKLGKFGSTDAATIASFDNPRTKGKGLETLCFEKVSEKLTGKFNSEYTNEAMQNGNDLESLARSAIELEYGEPIEQCGIIEMNEHVLCSPDGLVNSKGLIEIKCPTNRVFVEYLYNKLIDPKYIAQMQFQMMVSDRQWVDYAVFNPNFEKALVIARVERDEEFIKKLRTGLDLGIARVQEILKNV